MELKPLAWYKMVRSFIVIFALSSPSLFTRSIMRPVVALGLVCSTLILRAGAAIPDKIHGVNLGSWLVLEPWMLPQGMEASPPIRASTFKLIVLRNL